MKEISLLAGVFSYTVYAENNHSNIMFNISNISGIAKLPIFAMIHFPIVNALNTLYHAV